MGTPQIFPEKLQKFLKNIYYVFIALLNIKNVNLLKLGDLIKTGHSNLYCFYLDGSNFFIRSRSFTIWSFFRRKRRKNVWKKKCLEKNCPNYSYQKKFKREGRGGG
uniref:Uncharacterized protein n=1 Tax=Cacopsylla melanoneura TaxID=428564 RepID=A0A8D8RUR8_9HEMI